MTRVHSPINSLLTLADHGLPDVAISAGRKRRRRLLNVLLSMFVLSLPMHAASRLALGLYEPAIVSGMCWLVFLVLQRRLWAGVAFDVVARQVLFVGYATATATLWVSVAPAPTLAFIAGIPLLATALLDRRSTIAWSIVALLTVALAPLVLPSQLAEAGVAHSVSYCILVLYNLGIGVFQRQTAEDASQDFQVAAARADAANASKSAFIANISHELRTPMHGILGLVEMLMQGGKVDAESRQVLETIQHAGRTLAGLLDDLLDLSKIESGKVVVESVAFQPSQVVSSVMDLLRESADRKRIHLTFEAGPGVDHEWIGDPTRLRQVLLNLVGNALKFTDRGSVTVCGRVAANRLRFDVVDTGVGIPKDRLKGVFEPFVQAEDSTTRRYGGTGLGLAICRGLVNDLQGEIDVESEQGRGSRFWFEVPVAPSVARVTPPAAPARAAELSDPAVARRPAGERLLVAEDDPTSQVVIRKMLESLGYSVDVVSDGAPAVELVERNPGRYRLVLMDWHMPNLDGLAATRMLRARGHTLPVIALTASTRPVDQRAAHEAGMSDFVGKPFQMDALARCLQRHLSAELVR